MSPRHVLAAWSDALAPKLRAHIPEGSVLRRTLRLVRRRLRQPDPHPAAQVIFEFARTHPAATFVQIGSNDGMHEDPLREEILNRRWRGVLLEPVPYIFERLQETYRDVPGVVFERAAVADHDGEQEFFYLQEAEPSPGLPTWYDKLGSFRRDVVLSHRDVIPDIEDRLTTMAVPTMTFDTLCARHGFETVDVVHVDTEGYDYEVIKGIDLARYRPKLIVYEHLHLDRSDRTACEALLRSHDYELFSNPMDTVAVHAETLQRHRRLRRLWNDVT